MPKKLNIIGEKYSRLTVLRKGTDYVSPNGRKETKYVCQCECGTVKEIRTSALRSGYTKSCGCLNKELSRKQFTTHGKTDSKEYKTWCGIKQRCFNPNSDYYSIYGGRGITMCLEWQNSFEAFYSDMGDCPNPNYSIDRINPDDNYCKSNCRWVSNESGIQAINQRKKKSNTSGVKGVDWNKASNKWQARITTKGKRIYLGLFDTKEKAIQARRAAELKYHQPLLKKEVAFTDAQEAA